jgi:hypothetical protein
MKIIHTYHDGSELQVITSRELIRLAIWKGQRIMDAERVSEMQCSIGANFERLDSGYHVVRYKEEAADGRRVESTYLIDGQHRASVLRGYYESTICEPDFEVTVTVRDVESEVDAIEYFNKINNVKVQQWAIDPNLLINSYMAALERVFNKPRFAQIRPGKTKRPYLSSDSLRTAFLTCKHLIKGGDAVALFVAACEAYNSKLLHQLSIELLHSRTSKDKLKESAIKVHFALAYDERLDWVRQMLLNNSGAPYPTAIATYE